MKKVLVTGGTGFIGKHLADFLVEKGCHVRSFDFRPPREQDPGIEFILGDLRDAEAVEAAAAGCDVIYHLGAIPSIARAPYEVYHAINVGGTRHVMETAKKQGIGHVVYISSSTVYGIPNKFPLLESDVDATVGSYGRSKLDAEQICFDYSDIAVGIIRPRVVLGGGRIGIFSLLFDAVMDNGSVFMIGKGTNVFQFTGVADLVTAVVLAGKIEKSSIFNIGSTDQTLVRDVLAGLIANAESSSRLRSIPVGLAHSALKALTAFGVSPLMNEQFEIADKNFMLDTTKACTELNWVPSQSNLDCLTDAFEWYSSHRDPSHTQFKRFLGVLGKFRHSQQGAFQNSDKGLSI